MGIDRLERVLWRIRKRHPNQTVINNNDLRRAIMYECGIHSNTYYSNRKALIRLGWIKTEKNQRVILTNADIEGD